MAKKLAAAVVAEDATVAPVPSAISIEAVKRILPWLVAVAFFMQALDTTILNTAVPAIAQALGIAPLSMKAVLSSYTLSLAVFIPISGWMADRFGTRRVFAWAIGTFTLGSLLCGISNSIHLLVACRVLQGFGGAMMVPVGRLTLVRTFPKSELIRAMSFVAIPGFDRPHARPGGRRFHRRLFSLADDFFHQPADGFARPLSGSVAICRIIARRIRTPLDFVGLILFGTGIGLLAYVLEVFGEHTLGDGNAGGVAGRFRAMPRGLRVAGGAHRVSPAASEAVWHPHLSRVRQRQLFHAAGHWRNPVSVSTAVSGGPGFHANPVRPAHHAAGHRGGEPENRAAKILQRFGYRRVLIFNTLMLGVMTLSFATIGAGTPVWLIVAQVFIFGIFTSLQYSSMNTLVYADVTEEQTSGASAITSTVQQMSISFGDRNRPRCSRPVLFPTAPMPMRHR